MRHWVSIFSILLSFGLFSQVTEGSISIDKHSFKIGEQTTVHVEVNSRENTRATGVDFKNKIPVISLSANQEDSSFLEIIEVVRDTFVTNGDVFKTYVAYKITAWDTGKFMIPPHLFKANTEEVFSLPIEFSVGTVRVDTTKDIKEIKPILFSDESNKNEKEEAKEDKTASWMWIAGGILVVLILAFLIWFVLKKPKEETEQDKVVLKPHELALSKLEKLHQLLNEGIENKVYYSELTIALRVYIEQRYLIPSLEKTTNQLLKSLRSKELSPAVYEDLKALLQIADLVKFAKSNPDVHLNEINYLKAVSFINNTKPKEAPTDEV